MTGTGDVEVAVGIGPLHHDDVVAVARAAHRVTCPPQALAVMQASRDVVERLAAGPTPVYGVSTGFGALATRQVPTELRERLQVSLIRSHAAGSGTVVETEVVRAMMLLRLRTMTTGATGVRPVLAETLAGLLNAGLTPTVHEYGSLGCSGDLAPLSAIGLALIGEGDLDDGGGPRPASEVMAEHGVEPVVLQAKEGLGLINGTEGMLGTLILALHDLGALLRVADIAAAMSVEALLGTDQPFAADLMAMRPQVGQQTSAANLRRLLSGSAIVASHADPEADTRVQDAYSLRCSPQVHGAARDTVAYAAQIAERESNASIDNPVVTPDGRVASNGNFHGAPVAHALDFLAIVAADVASISERRLDRLLDVKRSHGLPAFLADDPGVDSGHMIAQYTAAGIVSEMKRLAVPASVDSIPSSALQEDHVSMGWAAARKLRRAVDGLTRVLAIEALTAARGLDLRAPLQPAPGTGAALGAIREVVAGPGPDRHLAPEIEATVQVVADGSLLAAVEDATGALD